MYKGSKHQTNTLLSPDTIQCTRGQNIKQILYYPQKLYRGVQGVKTSNTYFIIPRHYTVVYKGSKHQTNTLLSPDTIPWCTRGQNIKQILYYPQTLYRGVQGVKTSNKYFIIPRHYTVYKGSKHQTNTLLSPETIQCTRGQNIKQILYYPQNTISPDTMVYKGSKHQTNTLLSPDTIPWCTRGQNIKQILYYPQKLYSGVQGVKTSNKYFIIPRHYTVYKGSKHQTNTLLSPDTIPWCTRGQNIKHILYYPQTLYRGVQGVKTSNKYFIIPRHYTVVYKGSKHQTNTLLSPDTIPWCTRGQNIKQILYYPQTLYRGVQGVKTSNKYFIIPRHYTVVYKGSKHQTNTLLSPDTIPWCTRGQNIKQILYYPQKLYSVQGVKTSNKYFIIPRHYTVVYKGSKHQTNTLLSPDTIRGVQGVKTSNKYFIIPRHYTVVYKGSKHQTNTLLSPDTIPWCTRGQNIKQILYYPQTLYRGVQGVKTSNKYFIIPITSVQGVKTSNKYFIIPRNYTVVYKGSKHQTNTLLSPDTIPWCTRGQNIKQILYYPQTLYRGVQGVKTSNKYFIIPRHYTVVYKGSKHQTHTLLSPDTIPWCTRGQNIKQILYYPQTLYRGVQGVKTSNKYFIIPRHYTSVQGVKTSNKYFIIPRHYTVVYKGSKHQTNTLLSPDTIPWCTRGQNIKQILYYPQKLYRGVQGVKTSNKYFIIPRHYTVVYKGSKHQTNTLLSPDTIPWCTRGQNIKQILYYPQTLYRGVQGVKTSNKYFIIPRHYTVVYKGSKHQTNTLLSPDTIPWCTRGQNIKQILYYPQTLYRGVQGVKTSNKYFIIPRHYTVVYKGSKHQTNTLLSPDTIPWCTRGQNIKQILYYPQTLYRGVQGVKTSNKYFIIPRHYTVVYKGSKHQTNTLLSPDTIPWCTRGQNIKQILYYPQTLYRGVQGVKTSNKYFIIPRHYTVVYKGSKHQTNTLLSPDTIPWCTRGQNIKQILYYPQTLYSVQGVKTSNKYFIIPRHYTVVYKGSKHQTNTLLSPDTIPWCTRGQNIKQILYYPQTLYRGVQGVKTSNKYFIIPRHYTVVYKGSKHQTNTLLSPDTIPWCTRGQNIKQILYYPQTLYRGVQGVKTSNKYFIIPRHYTVVYKGSKHQTNTLLSPDTIPWCTRGQNIKQILYYPQNTIPVYKGSKHQTNTLLSPDTIPWCTRGQNIKQILYYPQTLYRGVQGVKTSNKYFIIPRHYTVVYKCTRGQNIKHILYYPQTLYSVQGVKTSNKYFIIPRHYTVVYKGSKHQTNTLLSPDTIPWCTRGQNIKHILYYPQTLYRVQGVKTSNKYFIIPRNYTVYKGSKHQTHTLLSPDTIPWCTRGQNIKQILYYPQTLYRGVQGVKTSNKYFIIPRHYTSVQGVKTSNKYFIIPRNYTVYKGSKHQTHTLLSPDTIPWCTRGQNIKQILYYPQTLYRGVQGVKTSNKYFIIPRHYTVVYKGSKHQTNTLLSPDTIPWCTRGQNIKQILYYPQTLYRGVQGVKTSNKYFIIPRHYTVVYKGSKHQTNTLLSPDTIPWCTRGQNIKQILYYPQTLYRGVQGVKTSNKYFIIPRHYTVVYKGSKHQTNTLLSPETIPWCTRGQNIKHILYYPQTLYRQNIKQILYTRHYGVQGVKTSNKYFIIPRHYTVVYKGSKHQTNTLLSPDTIPWCTRGQNIKQILYYPQTLYRGVQGVKTSNKYFIIPRHYTVVYKGSKHQTNTLLSPDTIPWCTRGQNIKQILYYPQTLYRGVQGVKTSNKYFIIPRHYTVVYKGSKHQTNTLLSPDTIPWCTRGQNIKHILYYPQTLYSVQGVKTSNKYFIIPRHYTVVYKGSKHQTNTLLSPDTIPWCTRGQNIKHILYYPQTLYRVQGVKTSNKYFIIPRNYTVVYKGSKHQTNTLLSPDTIPWCTRGQNIKQILYYPQTLYRGVQGVKTSNKYFIIPRHYTVVYKGSKHQTNTLLSPETIQCTRGQNIKQILYYPQTLYRGVQGVKTSNKYFIIPRHYTVVYKGSKHQTNTLLSPDTIPWCTRGQNIKQILYYPQTLYRGVQGVKTSNKYFIIPRHYTVVYKGSKHQTNTLLSPDTIPWCTRGQNIKQILYYPQTLYRGVQGVKTSNKYFIIPRHYTVVYKGSKHQTNTLLSPDTIPWCTRGQNIKQILYYPQTLYQCTRGQNIKQILYYPQTLYRGVQGVKTSNKYFIIPRHYTVVYKGSKHQTNTLLSPDTIPWCTRGQNIKQILYYPQTLYRGVQGVKTSNKYFIIPRHYTVVYKGSKHQTNTLLSPDTIPWCTRGQNIKQILYYPQTLYRGVQGVKTSNKYFIIYKQGVKTYFIIPRHYTVVYKGSKHQTHTLLSPDTIQCTRGQNIKQISRKTCQI